MFFYTKEAVFEHAGLNKDFKKMLSKQAEFKVLKFKDILTASDGTRKVEISFFGGRFCYIVLSCYQFRSLILNPQEVTDFIHIGRWTGY